MRMTRLILAVAALILTVLPSRADKILGPGRINGTNQVVLPGGPTLGRWQDGKYISEPDSLRMRLNGLSDVKSFLPLFLSMPQNGTYIAPWNAISYVSFQAHALEPIGGDFSGDGDHQRSQVYIRSTTSGAGDVAEYPLFVEMLATPASVSIWAASTRYEVGALAKTNGKIFKATTAGTSASSGTGPNSTASSITDGTVVWQYRCGDQCDAKITAAFTATTQPGSGNVWSMTTNTVLRPGAPTRFAIGYESDLTNYSENCPIDGSHFCVNLWLYGDTKYTSTAGLVLSTGAQAGTYAYYFGMWIQAAQGGNVAQNADIANDGSAKVGLSFGETVGRAATHSTATIRDLTTSPIGYKFGGAYSAAAIDMQAADIGTSGHAVILKAGQDVCFNGGNACWFWNSADGRMKFKVNGIVLYSIDSNGAVRAKGGFTTDANP